MAMRMLKIRCWALPLLVTFLSQDVAAARPVYSWGKPGVSRADYDTDAVACSLTAASRDVSADSETHAYVQGFEALERENNMPPMARPDDDETQATRNVLLRRMYRPDRKVDALQAKLQDEVEECLAARGYTRFSLPHDQLRRLKKLRVGSIERRDYLFSLASSADIVAVQRANAEGR
ncbi:hypothetical protein [Sphingomonas sp. 1P08PE]|uniref:hypothetical protein n=1 Tax=Sphingomonas sp. 1P08PE TaxID=554122 RepID=UPI0039A3D7D6